MPMANGPTCLQCWLLTDCFWFQALGSCWQLSVVPPTWLVRFCKLGIWKFHSSPITEQQWDVDRVARSSPSSLHYWYPKRPCTIWWRRVPVLVSCYVAMLAFPGWHDMACRSRVAGCYYLDFNFNLDLAYMFDLNLSLTHWHSLTSLTSLTLLDFWFWTSELRTTSF